MPALYKGAALIANPPVMNGDWIEEPLPGGIYRLTLLTQMSITLSTAFGNIYSGGIAVPARPTGFTPTHSMASVSAAESIAAWCALTRDAAFLGVYSGQLGTTTFKVTIILYGTKT